MFDFVVCKVYMCYYRITIVKKWEEIMIAYIKGVIVQKNIDCVIVECMGIGYEVLTSTKVIEKISGKEDEVLLHTYLKITEDSHTLYGFLNRGELDIFKKLIGISGVGPKAALSIMSTMDEFSLKMAIISEDYKAISVAQGVGIKIAKRIILDLKEKIDIDMGEAKPLPSDKGEAGTQKEVIEALIALGYSNSEAYKAIKGIDIKENDTVESVLKAALKKLAVF